MVVHLVFEDGYVGRVDDPDALCPLAISPDDGRFSVLFDFPFGTLPPRTRDIALDAAVRAKMSRKAWVNQCVRDAIDRTLADVPAGATIHGYVYVIGPLDRSKVKVGHSKSPRSRLSGLRHALALPELALFYARGVIAPSLVEAEAHKLLSSCSLGAEWFQASPTIAAAAVREAAVLSERYLATIGQEPAKPDESAPPAIDSAR